MANTFDPTGANSMASIKDRITRVLADSTREMNPLESFANVGRAAAKAATSDVTFGDVMNAQKAERLNAAKEMANFLRQERQLELQEEAGQRAEGQFQLQKDQYGLQERQFGLQERQFESSEARAKITDQRDADRLQLQKDQFDLSREEFTYRKLQDAAENQNRDAAAVVEALQTLVPEEHRAVYAAALQDLPYEVNGSNVVQAIGRVRAKVQSDLPSSPADFDDVTALRKNFESLAGDFIDVRNSYGTILGLTDQLGPNLEYTDPANSGPGDLSLIFAYMKMLDPGSTVREGEKATAEQARSVPSSVLNLYNNIVEGASLTPAQRKAFINQAASQYRQRQVDYDRLAEGYRNIAQRNQFDPRDVVLDYAGPYRYRVMSDEELRAAIDAADESQRTVLEAEVKRRFGGK